MSRTANGLLWLASSLSLWPQAPAPPQDQPEVVSHEAPAAFSSRVNLVSVPVVVRDRNGATVGNLRQEDFGVADKGRAQTITKFSVETGAAVNGSRPNPGAAADANAQTKPTLPQRYVAFLFDDVHMKPGDMLQGRQAANRQLDRTLDPGTRVGIFTTSGQTTQDFSADADKLHAAIDRIQPWEGRSDKQQDCPYVSYYLADLLINQDHSLSPGLSDQQVMGLINNDPALSAVFQEAEACLHTTNLQQVLGQVRNAAAEALRYGMEETKVSLDVMRDLVRSMGALPGNRTIVMVSPGFLLAWEHRLNENDIFDKAIHAGVTINTLDIRGVATPSGFEARDKGYSSGALGQMMQYENAAASQAQDLLAEVALATGGRFFHFDNGIEQGIKELAARPEYLYVLGFSPDNLKFDGGYHRLKVTLKNGAGLTIDARRGYWAPNHAVDPAEQAKEDIEDAVFSRDEIQEIPVKIHTEFFRQSDVKVQLTVEARVDLKGLKFKKADGRNRDNLTVVIGLFDDNGRYLKGTEKTLEMQLRDQTLEAGRTAGLPVKETFDVPPGRYVVRVVMRDSEGHSMSAKNEGVEIP